MRTLNFLRLLAPGAREVISEGARTLVGKAPDALVLPQAKTRAVVPEQSSTAARHALIAARQQRVLSRLGAAMHVGMGLSASVLSETDRSEP